jgi:hypothetical protein
VVDRFTQTRRVYAAERSKSCLCSSDRDRRTLVTSAGGSSSADGLGLRVVRNGIAKNDAAGMHNL